MGHDERHLGPAATAGDWGRGGGTLRRERARVSYGKEKIKHAKGYRALWRAEGGRPWRAAVAFQEGTAALREARSEGRKEGSKTELLEGGLISQADILFFPSFAIFQCGMVMRGVRAEL